MNIFQYIKSNYSKPQNVEMATLIVSENTNSFNKNI